MYLKVANLSTGFFSIGGQTTASPALTAISPSTLVAFSRGTNGAGYYNRYTEAEGLTGWQSMGGRLTSGLAAGSGTVAGKTNDLHLRARHQQPGLREGRNLGIVPAELQRLAPDNRLKRLLAVRRAGRSRGLPRALMVKNPSRDV